MDKIKNGLFLGVILAALLAMSFFSKANVSAKDMVIFTSQWCANCRQINPVASQLAQEKGITVHVIDVEDPAAPKQAQRFGLAIPSAELPQVYEVEKGQVVLIYDGNDYEYGMAEDIRADMNKNMF